MEVVEYGYESIINSREGRRNFESTQMKGYTFEIKNNLLEKKHIKAMGVSVWLFMWLDDKITKVDEHEVGWVLGGKPIKYEDIHRELGISQRTYTRWIDQLVKYPYINAIRTPYGISFRVYKAHKKFGKRSDRSGVVDTPKVANLLDKSGQSNKTSTVDRTVDNAPASGAPFIFLNYLKELENHKARHVNVIGHYFEEKKITYDTREKANAAIKRHLRAAKEVAKFSDQEIVKATSEARHQYKDLWTVETILKILTR